MKILLAVTGSISAYKAIELTRLLVKNSHQVRVILSKGATEFVKANLFRYLGAQEVYSTDSDFSMDEYRKIDGNVLHIELARWCERFVVYPLSANTLSIFANAGANDLISSVFLALESNKPKIIFPAMNSMMLSHPFVQENLNKLESLNNIFFHPTSEGEMACGEEGLGKLASVEEASVLIENLSFSKKKHQVLITTGATYSPLDPVRYLTNPSSGKTGYHLSASFLQKGYQVDLIATPSCKDLFENFKNHPDFKLYIAKTTQDMKLQVEKLFENCQTYISAAAINDIEFNYEESKLKKEKMSETLAIKKSPDILQEVLLRKKNQNIIGFAAETSTDENIFIKKWNNKKVDLLVGNYVNNGLKNLSDEAVGFNQEKNKYFFVINGELSLQNELSKKELASKLSDWVEQKI